MADKFPTTLGTSPITLNEALRRSMEIAGQIKARSTTIRAQSAAGPVETSALIAYTEGLAQWRTQLAAVVATPGLGTYAQQQFPTLDMAASYAALLAQIDATVAWITANFPVSGTGELLERKFQPDGRTVLNTFTTAQLNNFRSAVDALILTLN